MDGRWLLLSVMAVGCTGGGSDDGADTSTGDVSTGPSSTDGMVEGSSTGGSPTSADSSTDDGGSSSESGTPDSSTSTGSGSESGSDSGSGSGSGSDSGSGSESTTGGETSAFFDACLLAQENYNDCFNLGYSPAEMVALCNDYEDYALTYDSEACVGASTDWMACLSGVECKALMTGDIMVPGCGEEYTAGNEVCPENFPYCAGGAGGSGPGGCMVEAFDCLDGASYGVTCDAQVCTCTVDGEDGPTFASTGAEACFDAGFSDLVAETCGFPQGVELL